jgi:hypothetical protein
MIVSKVEQKGVKGASIDPICSPQRKNTSSAVL